MNRENDTVCGTGKAGLCGLIPVLIFMIMVFNSGSAVVWAQGAEEATDWEEARCGYAEEMRRFIKKYPDSEYRIQAEGCLISLLLKNCKVYLESGRLTGGAGGNAYDCYEEVLALDSVNAVALSGLREIEDKYIELARRKLELGDLVGADRLVEKVRGLNPEREEVLELEWLLEQERMAKKAASLLAECAAHLEVGRLTEGARGNAYDCYDEVITLDSGNVAALSGFKAIEDKYIEWAHQELESGDLVRAGQLLDKVRGLNPERKEVVDLGRLLGKAKQIAPLLSKCGDLLKSGQLTEEAVGSAYECYQSVIALAPGNVAALSGLKVIENKYIELTKQGLESGDLVGVGRLIDKVRELNPKHKEVVELERLLKEAEEAAALAEQESQAAKEAERERLVGEVFKDCDECPGMVVVPSGSYRMGSAADEADRDEDEGPVRTVTIPANFAVGQYEVSFEEWEVCVSAGGCGGYQPDDQDWGRGRRPVINVSWEDAKKYVRWLSDKTGNDYGLLSESEWEYVARAGIQTVFHTGDQITTDQANFNGSLGKTVQVGSFSANGFDLHDMHGNVWEWVEDCWTDSYSGAPTDGSARTSGDCEFRVLRGGSWSRKPWNVRMANRFRFKADDRNDNNGFRVSRKLMR